MVNLYDANPYMCGVQAAVCHYISNGIVVLALSLTCNMNFVFVFPYEYMRHVRHLYVCDAGVA